MAILFRLSGLKAVGAYDDALALINDYLNDIFAQSGRKYEPEALHEHLASSDIDEALRVRICALLKEKSAILLAMGDDKQASRALHALLFAMRETAQESIDREGRQKLLSDLCRDTSPTVIDPPLFSLFLSTLIAHGLYAKADDTVFRYEAVIAEPSALAAIMQMYDTMMQLNESELRTGNFSRQEVEESLEELIKLSALSG